MSSLSWQTNGIFYGCMISMGSYILLGFWIERFCFFFPWNLDIHTLSFSLDLFLCFQKCDPGFYAFKRLENDRKYWWRLKKLDITRETNMFTLIQHPYLLPCPLPSPLNPSDTHKQTQTHKHAHKAWINIMIGVCHILHIFKDDETKIEGIINSKMSPLRSLKRYYSDKWYHMRLPKCVLVCMLSSLECKFDYLGALLDPYI